jgi:hypothetical protein
VTPAGEGTRAKKKGSGRKRQKSKGTARKAGGAGRAEPA